MSGHPHDRSIAALLVGTVLLCALVAVAVLGASGSAIAAAEVADSDAADSDAVGALAPHVPAASASGASAAAVSGAAGSDASTAAAPDAATASERTATDGAARSAARSAAGQADARLAISNASVAPDGSTTLELSLARVPDGLSGFQVTLELTSPDVAAFEGASYPERYGHTSTPAVAGHGQSITLEAVDLHDEVTDGDTDVALATIEIAGDAEGEARVSAADFQIDADGGDEIQPTPDPGVVRVTADGSSDPSTAAASTVGASDGDATDDGRSADDGSGRLDPLHLGAVVALVLASLLAVVAVRLRER